MSEPPDPDSGPRRGHAHHHGHHRGHHHGASTRLGIAFALNFTFTIIEIVGGLWTNSIAIVADAIHDLGDTLSLGIAWSLERYARRSGNAVFSFGYRRFSLLGALVTALVLVVGSLVVLSHAIPRLIEPEPADARGMMALAVLGVVVNGIAAFRLRGGKTLNERMMTWHLFEDVLGWAAVLVVGAVMLVWEVHILDPLLSLLITLFILWNVVGRLRETLVIFLQGMPDSVDRTHIESKITDFDEVAGVHHTHMWSQDGERHVLTAHVVVQGSPTLPELDALRARIKARLAEQGIDHVTLEMETHSGRCTDDCGDDVAPVDGLRGAAPGPTSLR